MESFWKHNLKKPTFPTLEGEVSTDVLVIGGGMTGLLCSYFLQEAGVDAVLAEGREICSGTTGNTTAKITCHHGAIFDKMTDRYGETRASGYVKAQQDAIKTYASLAKRFPCDYTETVSAVYSRDNREKIEKEVWTLNQLGCPAEFTTRLPLPFSVAGAVVVAGQARFHPLKFAYKLAEALHIYENTPVTELREGVAVTPKGKIRAKKIIVATHFPFLNKHGFYFLKLYQHRSYVLALKNAPLPPGMYVDERATGLSFRTYEEYLLLGGGGHRTGKQGGGWQELQDFAALHYPEAEICFRYAAQDCKTLDDIPYIGPYSPNTPNLFVATGFNKWGMTNAMVAAEILTATVQRKKHPAASVFSPQRSVFYPQLAVNAWESARGLLTPATPRCTHLGCALKYNKQEHSWDCACHGSRFSEEGNVLENPAAKPASPKFSR